MNILERFQAYAAAFEETYLDDDWNRLEDFFAPEATYQVQGLPAFAIDAKGRDDVLAALRDAINRFDRRCASRTLELTAPPEVTDDTVTLYWAASYTLEGAPPIRIPGIEAATYDDQGRIVQLVDRYEADAADAFSAWASEHFTP